MSQTKARSWCFTLNNPTAEQEAALKVTLKNGKYLWQKEVGESGTPHLQGVVSFKNAISFNSARKKINGAHITKCKSLTASIKYCQKEEGRLSPPTTNNQHWISINGTGQGGPRARKSKETKSEKRSRQLEKLRDPIKEKGTLGWQQDVLDIIDQGKADPEDRKIHWFWEATGNVGKTTIAKHICINNNAIYLQGKAADCKYGVAQWLQAHDNELDVAIFGYSRTLESYVSYTALEQISDGFFYSPKYEGEMCMFNSPTMLVFANFAPDTDALSNDRWVIHDLNNMSERAMKPTKEEEEEKAHSEEKKEEESETPEFSGFDSEEEIDLPQPKVHYQGMLGGISIPMVRAKEADEPLVVHH